MITAEKQGNRVILRGGPIPGVRSIPGAYLRESTDTWSFPLSMETCVLLRRRLGATLKIGPDLRVWAKAEKRKRKTLHALANSADAVLHHLPGLAPELAAAMNSRTYQRVAVRFIADAKRVLLADEQGLGKTLEIMGGILESEVLGPYLVVCPKSAVTSVWQREIRRWLGSDVMVLPDGKAKRDAALADFRENYGTDSWLVINPEVAATRTYIECNQADCDVQTPYKRAPGSVLKCGHEKLRSTVVDEHKHPDLFDIEWGAVVVDECHDSLIARSGVPTQRRRGLELLDIHPDGVRIAASGTPMRDKPEKLWGVLNWVDPEKYKSKWTFIKQYWQTGGFSGWEIGEIRPDRERLLWDSLKPVLLRRTKAEVATDLPPKTHVGTPLLEGTEAPRVVWLPMEGKQARAYRQMVRDSVARVRGGSLEAINPLAEMIRRRQLAASYGAVVDGTFYPQLPSNKFDYVLQLLEQLGYPEAPETKVLIFSSQTKLLKLFAAELNRTYRRKLTTLITGSTPTRLRSLRIERFNRTDQRHIMLLNIKAGGSAITIDTADHSVFLDRSQIADQESQAEDRTHRVSKPRSVFYHYLVSEGTIDAAMSILNAEKSDKTHRILDVRREVDFARRAIELEMSDI